MRTAARTIAVLLLFSQANPGWSYPWDQDMVDQPLAKPQRSPAPAEPDAVPVVGGETMPSPTTEKGMTEAKDAAAAVPNPIPATAESLAQGEYLYQLNCLVCHGKQGKGDGPVGLKFVTKSPVDLHKQLSHAGKARLHRNRLTDSLKISFSRTLQPVFPVHLNQLTQSLSESISCK